MCNWLARWFDPERDLGKNEIAGYFAELALFGLAPAAAAIDVPAAKQSPPRSKRRRVAA